MNVHMLRAMTFAVLVSTPLSTALAMGPILNKAAPEFTGTDFDGQTRSLAEFKGKYVVLEWLNHGCPFVKKHYDSGNMQKLQATYTGKGVVWLSIITSAPGKQGNVDGPGAKAQAQEKKANPTTVILDTDGVIGSLYLAKTTPHMFVINPEGLLIYKGAIDSVRSTDPGDIEGATNYVAKALDSAMAGQPVETPKTQPYGCSVKY